MKKKHWISIIFDVASDCKGKLFLSVMFAIISVFIGLIPYIGVYKILCLFFEKSATIDKVFMWGSICILAYFFKIFFFGISTILSHISAYTILEELRLRIIDKMMKAPLGRVLSETSGRLKGTIVDRVETIELPLAHMIPEGISNFLLPLGVMIYMIYIDWRIALASLITLPFAGIAIFFLMRNFNKQYADFMEASNNVNSVIVEYVGGIEVIKAFSQGEDSYDKFTNAIKVFKEYTLEWFNSTWKVLNFITSVLPSTLVGTLPIGIWLYYKDILTPAEFSICMILSLSIMTPLMWFTTAVDDMKSIEYAVNDATELLELEELPNTKTFVDLKDYDVNIANVSFSYESEKKVLENINLEILEGEFCALVGPSGGGKSTIARLIARFWDVDSGSIIIGGVNIKEIPLKQLCSIVSFVTQDNFLFDCSLLENIRLGNPKATDKEVYEISKLSQCDEFITQLPNGYNTTAGEAGRRLSGGEKQRIAIARAMLKNAPIVILDEATAFTDPENEEKIQKAISILTKGKTLLVIAHRLSTIKEADKIVVLKDGKILAIGNQEKLIKECNTYKEMWNTHIGAKKWSIGKDEKYVQNY